VKLCLLLSMMLQAGSQDEAPLSVFSNLGEASHQEIQAALDLASPGLTCEFRAVSPSDLLIALERLPGTRPAGLLGYPLPLLIDAGRAGRLGGLPERLPLDHEAFRPNGANGADGATGPAYVACWFSPVVLVRGLTDVERHELEGLNPDWLPEQFQELGEGRFQGLLLLQTARSWNAFGVLLAGLQRQSGDQDRADRLFAGLDANRAGPNLLDSGTLLNRLAGRRQIGVSTLRQFRRSPGAEEGTLASFDPGGQPAALVYGLAGLAGSSSALAPLLAVLRDPDLIIKIALLEHLIPASNRIDNARLEPWMLPYRLWFEGNASQLALDQEQAQRVAARFRNEIMGSLARKQEVFSKYFDTIAIALMAIFIIWVIRHREDRVRSQK